MLSLLTGAPSSASELARGLQISQAAASYHLRQLHAAGVVALAEVRAKRGGRERVFTYVVPEGRSSAAGSDHEAFRLYAETIALELRRRSGAALPGSPRLGVDAELWVEPSQWDAAVDAVRAASLQLHEQANPPRTPGTVRVSMSAALFRMTTPLDSGSSAGE